MLSKLTGREYINYSIRNRIVNDLIHRYSSFMDAMHNGSESEIKELARVFYFTVINAYENYDLETEWVKAAYENLR